MHFSVLMVSKSNFLCGGPGSFSRRGGWRKVVVRGGGLCENRVTFSLNDGPMETVEYMWVNIWCMLDWIIGFCHKTAEIHFLGISCSTFSLFTFHLANSTLSAYVKPSLENNSSNLLISFGVVIKITVYLYSIKFNFIKALFSACIIVYCSLPTTNWLRSENQVVCYHQNSPMMHSAECEK